MNLLGNPTIEFCEKAVDGIIKRPFYAFSNLSYLIVGFIILGKKTRYSKPFGYIAILVGLLSFGYDASYTYISQLLDLLGMLIFVNLVIYLSTKRLFSIKTKKLLIFQIIAVILGMFTILYFKSFSGDFVFGFFVLTAIILELSLWKAKKTREVKMWFAGLAVFVLAFIIWLFDANGLWCDPTNMVNGRSIFHILTSITIFLLYKYNESQVS
ncbi:MAG: ceramidase domain-containing protein [Candidatus Doudnabacteria bacterium]